MKSSAKVVGFVFLLLPVLMSCASTKLTHVWKDEAYNGRPVADILVLGVTDEDAIRMTGNLGCCITYSSQHPDHPIEVSPNWIHNSESILTGAVNPSIISFDQAVNVLSKGIIAVNDLISVVYLLKYRALQTLP